MCRGSRMDRRLRTSTLNITLVARFGPSARPCPGSLVVSPVSVAYVDITTGRGSFYRLWSGRYIEWGRVVISSVWWSIYRLVPTRSVGLPKSIYRLRDLLRATSRPPWRFRYTGFGKSWAFRWADRVTSERGARGARRGREKSEIGTGAKGVGQRFERAAGAKRAGPDLGGVAENIFVAPVGPLFVETGTSFNWRK